MLSRTIFNTPVITPIARLLFRTGQWLAGWKIVGGRPNLDKCVYVAGPHTSNWDFPLMLSVCFCLKIQSRWIGKHTLFPPVIGGFMRWLGGISIDRRKSCNTVEQMRQEYERRDHLELVITPEGTRSKVREWKSGFYHIAVAARVPIVMAGLDAATKIVEISEPFYPTGDYAADLKVIKKFFEGKLGIRAERT